MICGRGGKNGEALHFGDHVAFFIPGHGSPAGQGYVAGEMAYSTAGDVILLVTEDTLGMPIAAGHCWTIGSRSIADVEAAARLRERYVKLWPKGLKPLEADQ